MFTSGHQANSRASRAPRNNNQRNAADYPVLGILSQGPAHGYDLCRKLREALGEVWQLHTSHIYALLSGLERDGLALHERVDQDARPSKKVFSVTEEGRRVFLMWVRSPVTNMRNIRLEFLAKFFFCGVESPTALRDLISRQLSVCRRVIKRIQNSRGSCGNELEQAAVDFRLATLYAVEAWLIDLRELRRRRAREEFRRPLAARVVVEPEITMQDPVGEDRFRAGSLTLGQ